MRQSRPSQIHRYLVRELVHSRVITAKNPESITWYQAPRNHPTPKEKRVISHVLVIRPTPHIEGKAGCEVRTCPSSRDSALPAQSGLDPNEYTTRQYVRLFTRLCGGDSRGSLVETCLFSIWGSPVVGRRARHAPGELCAVLKRPSRAREIHDGEGVSRIVIVHVLEREEQRVDQRQQATPTPPSVAPPEAHMCIEQKSDL